jgi:hypothetical protein
MQRSTARFLLLLALGGTFLPLALSAAAPSHACCLRAAHRCHSTSESEERTVNGITRCGHDCCRGVTTSQAAHPKPSVAVISLEFSRACAAELLPAAPRANSFCLPSTRAPPIVSLS